MASSMSMTSPLNVQEHPRFAPPLQPGHMFSPIQNISENTITGPSPERPTLRAWNFSHPNVEYGPSPEPSPLHTQHQRPHARWIGSQQYQQQPQNQRSFQAYHPSSRQYRLLLCLHILRNRQSHLRDLLDEAQSHLAEVSGRRDRLEWHQLVSSPQDYTLQEWGSFPMTSAHSLPPAGDRQTWVAMQGVLGFLRDNTEEAKEDVEKLERRIEYLGKMIEVGEKEVEEQRAVVMRGEDLFVGHNRRVFGNLASERLARRRAQLDREGNAANGVPHGSVTNNGATSTVTAATATTPNGGGLGGRLGINGIHTEPKEPEKSRTLSPGSAFVNWPLPEAPIMSGAIAPEEEDDETCCETCSCAAATNTEDENNGGNENVDDSDGDDNVEMGSQGEPAVVTAIVDAMRMLGPADFGRVLRRLGLLDDEE